MLRLFFKASHNGYLCREKLKQLIEKRIGKENFIEKLGFISKHELYSRASQKPQPNFPSPEYMIFDHEFTKLVKELEGKMEFILIFIRKYLGLFCICILWTHVDYMVSLKVGVFS